MSASIALKKAVSRPRKPLDPMWIPAVGISLMSTGIGLMNGILCLANGILTPAPSTIATTLYGGYGMIKAFRNLAATSESILNHYVPDTTIPLTPMQSMANSFNAMAHSSVAMIGSNIGAYMIDSTENPLVTISTGLDIILATFSAAAYKAFGGGNDNDNDKQPPKDGPKP